VQRGVGAGGLAECVRVDHDLVVAAEQRRVQGAAVQAHLGSAGGGCLPVGGGEHPRDPGLRLGVERTGHDQDADVLARLLEQPEPSFAGDAGPVGVEVDELGLAGLLAGNTPQPGP
jgi:hypothetical protein